MSLIKWDESGKRTYRTGIDKVAFHVWDGEENEYGPANPWNGATAVNESPSGAEVSKLYADNHTYLSLISKEEFAATVEAYQTPVEFYPCDGKLPLSADATKLGAFAIATGQKRTKFALCYRELIGDDNEQADASDSNTKCIYHVVYGCKASPASRDNTTISDSPEAATISYEINTTPDIVAVDGVSYEITHVKIDLSRLTTGASTKLATVLSNLYDDTNSLPDAGDLYTALA